LVAAKKITTIRIIMDIPFIQQVSFGIMAISHAIGKGNQEQTCQEG
jgi:hypothetical protein